MPTESLKNDSLRKPKKKQQRLFSTETKEQGEENGSGRSQTGTAEKNPLNKQNTCYVLKIRTELLVGRG